jgi:hypothetical protein
LAAIIRACREGGVIFLVEAFRRAGVVFLSADRLGGPGVRLVE